MNTEIKMNLDGYRPVSKFVFPTVLFAALAGTAFIDLVGLWFVIPTLLFGTLTLIEMKKYGFIGVRLTALSILFSLFLLLIEPINLTHRFLNESPPEYKRVSFNELLKSDGFNSLVGQKICLKGHTLFHSYGNETLKTPTYQFAFSPDGDPFRPGRSIIVEIANIEAMTAESLIKPLAVSGVLERTQPHNSRIHKYTLKDAIVRESKTKYLILSRSGGGC